MDRAADSGPYDPSSTPLGEKKEKKRKKETLAEVGPYLKKEGASLPRGQILQLSLVIVGRSICQGNYGDHLT